MLGLTDFLCQVSVPFLSCSCSRVDHVCVFLFSSFEQINDDDDDYKIVTVRFLGKIPTLAVARTDSNGFPGLFTDTSDHIHFLLFSFLLFHFLVQFRTADPADFLAHAEIASRIVS